eukprot:jgi/Tetstr1/459779/TSEL_005132.t1
MAIAIRTAPLANLELPTVERLAEAIAATISHRINTPPELRHDQWLTDTVMAAGVEMQQCHTEPTLLRVGDDNLCAISLGKEDEEFADTLRMAVALTSPVALLRRPLSPYTYSHSPSGNRHDRSKGKAAASAKHKKKQPRCRSRSGGASRNRSKSKPRLSRARDSDSEWQTDDEAARPSDSSHQ